MKKIMVMVMAVAAISFSSCCNKTDKCGSECDSTQCDSTQCCGCKCDPCECDPCECGKGECPMKAMSEALEAGDAAAATAALTTVGEKIKTLIQEGKTEEAQKIASAVKEFIDTNKEKLEKAQISTENIVSTITSLPEVVAGTAEAGAEAVKTDVKTATDAAVEAGKAKVEEKANEAVEAGKAKANEAIDDAAAKAKSKLGL